MITPRSFQALFLRYRALHRAIRFFPRKIVGPDGVLVGRMERIRIVGNLLEVRGWTRASSVVVSVDGQHLMTLAPAVARPDVAAAWGIRTQSGFEFEVPLAAGRASVSFLSDGHEVACPLPHPGWLRLRAEDMRLGLGLGWAGLRGLPAIHRYLSSSDSQTRDSAKMRLKHLLGIGIHARRDHLFSITPPATPRPVTPDAGRVTIILPVYNAFDDLRECLSRVADHSGAQWHLILVEDCSSDPRIRPFLRDWAQQRPAGQTTLLENDTNLGFVGSVNRGFAAALPCGAPVVLLNSDAFLPDGWVPRLLAPLADPTVASVTPMCNDAEIMNVPVICQRSDMRPGEADRLDLIARDRLAQAPVVDLPTGVGFCMAIAPAWLMREPQFDTAFGRGYGEEVDWCRKIRRMGGRHVALPSLFVEHRGGGSFLSDAKRQLIAAHGQIIRQRYPEYDAEVQEFIAADPLIGPRLLLGLARIAAAQEDVPVYLGHALGGGAEDTVQRRVQADLAEGRSSVVLRVGGRFRYMVELHSPDGVTHGSTDDETSLTALLAMLPRREVIYVCGVGDLDAHELPDRLIDWSAAQGARLCLEIHDYFPVSPSYTLLNHRGHYDGPPMPAAHGADPAHQFVTRDRRRVDLAEWQGNWGRALRHADRVVVFSQSSRDVITSVWPDLETGQAITLWPHPPLHTVPRVSHMPQVPARRIGVLGNIGLQKGIAVLDHLSRQLSVSKGERLVVIGNIDPTYPLSRAALVHGGYLRAEIAALAERYEIDCWLIPSIWPETFSFTTREALATGLPVWCFDLGAQAEALRDAGQSAHVIPCPDDARSGARLILGHVMGRD